MFGTALQVNAFGHCVRFGGGRRPGRPPFDRRTAGRLKWAAILCFVAAPLVSVWTIVLAHSRATPEARARRWSCSGARPAVDTVVVGDSRVGRIAEGRLPPRAGTTSTWSLSGVSPGRYGHAIEVCPDRTARSAAW